MFDNEKTMNAIETIKENAVSNKAAARLITILLSIVSACSITGVLFVWQLKSDVPVLRENMQSLSAVVNELQKTVNDMRNENFDIRQAQAVTNEHVKNIDQKLNYK